MGLFHKCTSALSDFAPHISTLGGGMTTDGLLDVSWLLEAIGGQAGFRKWFLYSIATVSNE